MALKVQVGQSKFHQEQLKNQLQYFRNFDEFLQNIGRYTIIKL